jgi:hypothetical protein
MTLEASMATTTSGSSRPDDSIELTLEKFRRMEQKLCELQETQRLIRQKLAEQILEEPEEDSATVLDATKIALKETAGTASNGCAESESQLVPANNKSQDNLSEDNDETFSAEVKRLNAIKFFRGARNLHRCKNCDASFELAWKLKRHKG